jgi:aryl-alcohol dehydrogenase-like predicted oxidoreductase
MKFILGTAQFDDSYGAFKKNKISSKDLKNIFNIIYKNKISFLDTAISYNKSEYIIGKHIKKKINIFTKITFPKKLKKKNLSNYIKKKISSSLNKLKTKQLYCLYIHHISDLKKYGNDLVNNFLILKKKKIIKKIGISIYETSDLELAFKYFVPDVIQFPLNIFDSRFSNKKLLKKLKSLKIKLVARSCFLQGLLLNRNFDHIKFNNIHKNKILDYHDFCEKKSLNKLNLCLNFVKSFKELDYIVIGCDSYIQLSEILEFMKYKYNKNYKFYKEFIIKNKEIINPSLWKYVKK